MPPPTLLLGEFEHSIDDKSRLAVPARFRPALEAGLVVTRGLDRCLVIWDAETWRNEAESIVRLDSLRADVRRYKRYALVAATATPDRLGRVVIPRVLREYAQLETEVVIVGLGDRIEVWSRVEWERERTEAERTAADLAEHLATARTES